MVKGRGNTTRFIVKPPLHNSLYARGKLPILYIKKGIHYPNFNTLLITGGMPTIPEERENWGSRVEIFGAGQAGLSITKAATLPGRTMWPFWHQRF